MKKYNSIMGVFTKTATKLENLASANADKISTKTATIKRLKAEAQELDLEHPVSITRAVLAGQRRSEFRNSGEGKSHLRQRAQVK